MRIAFSRVSSSSTSALIPATRLMMKMRRPNKAGKPRSTRTAASAPSILSGIGLIPAAIAASSARANRMPSPSRPASFASPKMTATRGSIAECTRCPNPGSRAFARFASPTSSRRGRVERTAARARAVEALPDQLHAARSRAAVLVADREDAGGDRRGRRLAVARRGQPRRGAGRRAGAVIRASHQDGVEEAAFALRRQPLVMQQEDVVGERRPLHQLEDVVSANSDVVRASVDDGGPPSVHSSGWMLRPCR